MRNKISAWRKGGVVFTILLVTLTTLSEYISTLEMDIAERYRLLQAIRTEFGSIQSENVALRQEFAALKKKKALLEGRIGTLKYIQVLNLPSPAPLPPISAAAATASAPALATLSSSSLVTPNTRKDIPNSPRLGGVLSVMGFLDLVGWAVWQYTSPDRSRSRTFHAVSER